MPTQTPLKTKGKAPVTNSKEPIVNSKTSAADSKSSEQAEPPEKPYNCYEDGLLNNLKRKFDIKRPDQLEPEEVKLIWAM